MGFGKALSALTKKGFNTTKLKSTAGLAVSRSAVLKNQRQARVSISRSDVVNLLKMGNQDRALIRVEQVIRQQNGLDALVLLEGYCHLIIERINLVAEEKSCPDELREGVSSLIFASARMGDFPELIEIRSIFISRFGKEFVSSALELRNNCGVNPKIVQMLSTKIPSLEIRTKMLKKIAEEESIHLPSENTDSWRFSQDKQTIKREEEGEQGGGGNKKTGRKYKDVADAAQEAFESAAYAAAAARAALELSRYGNGDSGGASTTSDGKYDRISPVENWDMKKDETEEKSAKNETNNENVTGAGEDDKRKTTVEGNNGERGEVYLDINRKPVSVRTRKFQ